MIFVGSGTLLWRAVAHALSVGGDVTLVVTPPGEQAPPELDGLRTVTTTDVNELAGLFGEVAEPGDIVWSTGNPFIFRSPILDLGLTILNVHGGPLPDYRGVPMVAATYAILNGENRFGVTVHRVDAGIDTGEVVAQSMFDLAPDVTLEQLTLDVSQRCHDIFVTAFDPAGTARQLATDPQRTAAQPKGSYYGSKQLATVGKHRDLETFVRATDLGVLAAIYWDYAIVFELADGNDDLTTEVSDLRYWRHLGWSTRSPVPIATDGGRDAVAAGRLMRKFGLDADEHPPIAVCVAATGMAIRQLTGDAAVPLVIPVAAPAGAVPLRIAAPEAAEADLAYLQQVRESIAEADAHSALRLADIHTALADDADDADAAVDPGSWVMVALSERAGTEYPKPGIDLVFDCDAHTMSCTYDPSRYALGTIERLLGEIDTALVQLGWVTAGDARTIDAEIAAGIAAARSALRDESPGSLKPIDLLADSDAESRLRAADIWHWTHTLDVGQIAVPFVVDAYVRCVTAFGYDRGVSMDSSDIRSFIHVLDGAMPEVIASGTSHLLIAAHEPPEFCVAAAGDLDSSAVDIFARSVARTALALAAGEQVALAAPDGDDLVAARAARAASQEIRESTYWFDSCPSGFTQSGVGAATAEIWSGPIRTARAEGRTGLDTDGIVARTLMWLSAEVGDLVADGTVVDVERTVRDVSTAAVPGRLSVRYPVLLDPDRIVAVPPGTDAVQVMRAEGILPPDSSSEIDYGLLRWQDERSRSTFDHLPPSKVLIRVADTASELVADEDESDWWGTYVLLVTILRRPVAARARRRKIGILVQSRCSRELDAIALVGALAGGGETAPASGWDTGTVVDAVVNAHAVQQPLVQISAAQHADLETRFGEIAEVLPLSPLQEGFFYHLQLANESGTPDLYVSYAQFRLIGALDTARMTAAVAALLARTPNLTAGFARVDDRAVQVIPADPEPPVRVVYRSQWSGQDLDDVLEQERSTPFIADQPPLIRFLLLELAEDEWILSMTNEHLLIDGWSFGLVWSDLFALYNDPSAQSVPDRTGYRDYLAWLEEHDQTAAREAWRQYLTSAPGIADGDCPEPTIVAPTALDVAADAAAAADVYRYLDAELHQRVLAAGRSAGVTIGTFLQVAWGITLGRLVNRRDVVFGTSVSGRPPELAGAESIIGLLFNTVPVVVSAPPTASVRDVLAGQHSRNAGVLEAAHVPLSEIQRIAGYDQMFDTLFIMQNMPALAPDEEEWIGSGESRIRPADFVFHDSTHYPLSFAVYPGEQMRVRCSFRSDVFSESDVETIIDRLLGTLDVMSADIDAPVGRIGATVSSELTRFAEWNDTDWQTTDLVVGELLERQVARTPDETAIVAGDTRLTFAELLDGSRRYAALLVDTGVRTEDRVALLLPRDQRAVLALFGVFLAGGAYVPIEPDHPTERVAYILDAADPAAIVTTRALVDRLPDSYAARAVVLDSDDVQSQLAVADTPAVPTAVHPDNLAYVIFTSGSTGRPKGVAVGHRGLTNMYFNHVRKIFDPVVTHQQGRRMRIAHTTSFSFDASWEQLFWLLNGHEVHVIDESLRKDPQRLLEHYDRELIDGFDVTPSYGQVLVEEGLLDRPRPAGRSTAEADPGVVFVSLGGEAVPEALWTALRDAPGVESYNLYGPTEYTINALGADLADSPTSNAGRPIDNTRAHVLDANLKRVPPGTSGELYLAGIGMARGYFGRSGLTAERFVADPFGSGGRLYRTGDLVRWRSDGQLDFLGRTDDQIKIRGFRVELNEIAEAVRAQPSVSAAAVVPFRADGTEDIRLAAYYTASSDVTVAEVRDFVANQLPGYMVPVAFTELAVLPLNTNGKVDHAALPAPNLVSGDHLTPPANEMESEIRAIVAAVVGVADDTVSVDASFTDIGVDSLLLARLTSRINAKLAVALTLRSLIEHPTVADIALLVGGVADDGRQARLRIADVVRPNGPVPASYGQQSLWLMDQLMGPSDQYVVPVLMPLVGEMNIAALGLAVADVVGRHEALRTLLVADEQVEVRQEIVPAPEAAEKLSLHILDGSQWDTGRVNECLQALMHQPFALGVDLPIRAVLIGHAHGCILGMAVHHSALDEWSMPALSRDLGTAYAARSSGHAPRWSPLSIQYAQYAIWQRQHLGEHADQSSLLAQQLRYWERTLAGAPEVSGLPSVRSRPSTPSWSGIWRESTIADAVVPRLREVARRHDVSMFMLTQAAVALTVRSLGAGDDLVIGSPVGGRTDSDLDDLVGYFVNTLPLRYDLSGRPTLEGVLARVRSVVLAGFENQEAPFDAIVRAVGAERTESRTPLFQTMLMYREEGKEPPEFAAGIGLGSVERVSLQTVKCDVELYITVSEDKISTVGGYARELYDDATIERFLRTLSRVLIAFATDTAVPISQLDLVPDVDRELVAEWSRGPRVPKSPTAIVDDLIRVQCETTPEAGAVTFGDVTLSYRELNIRIDQMAHLLTRRGVRVGDRVAITLDRSEHLPIALAAVVRTGAVYIPVDPSYPVDRVRFILDDAAPTAVITDRHVINGDLSQILGDMPAAVVVDDPTVADELCAAPFVDVVPSRALLPDDAVALIYTSGSTGTPKGVTITHAGLVNRLRWAIDQFGTGGVGLAKSAIGFVDASTEIFSMLVRGGSLVVADTDSVRDAQRIASLIDRHGVTDLVTIPALADALIAASDAGARLSSVRRWICSGERLTGHTAATLTSLIPGVELINLYGTTEITGDATIFAINSAESVDQGDSGVSIGVPTPNTEAIVLDRNLRLVPPGVPGDLYLGGVQMAQGYHNRAALTADRFIAAPHSVDAGAPGTRLYRTGDLARWDGQGRLEYLGRSDDQVKIRGYRIELGEVSSALTTASINATAGNGASDGEPSGRVVATTVVDRTTDGLARIVGYVAPVGDTVTDDLDGENIRHEAARLLPAYMVPAIVVVVDALPLGANGKVDRDALPRPEFGSPSTTQNPPTTPTEEILCTIFSDILALTSVGIDDNFFLLGGHSLLAIRLANRIRSGTGTAVTLRGIFDTPTVSQIAKAIESGHDAGEQPPLVPVAQPPAELPLSFAQQRMWVLYQVQGPSPTYNVPMFWKAPSGQLDVAALRAAIADVVRQHCTLRTLFPSIDGRGVQLVQPPDVHVPVEYERVTEDHLTDGVATSLRHAFRLESEIPLRVSAFDFDGDHLVVIVIHHIATDEWSARRLRADLDAAYDARLAGHAPSYRPLPVDYIDYTLWERERVGNRDDPESLAARQLGFWRETLAGAPQELPLPLDRPRPAQISYLGGAVPVICAPERARLLRAIADRHQVSMFMLIHAAVAITLHRSGSGNDIVIGTPISGRSDEQLEDLVGFFLNTVVLRTDLSGNPSIGDTLARIREADLAAFDNQDVPFEYVVDAIGPRRTMSMHPLFQVMVVYIGSVEAASSVVRHTTGGTLLEFANSTGTAKFDLSFDFTEYESGGFGGVVEYSTDLFDDRTVVAITKRFDRVLDAMVELEDARIDSIDVLGDERSIVMRPPVAVSPADNTPETIAELFSMQVQRDGGALAVISGSTEWTFADLDIRVRRVAAKLQSYGVGPECVVAICLPRSADYVAAIFGVLVAGAAYLPIDPSSPAARSRSMVNDSGAVAAIVDDTTDDSVPADLRRVNLLQLRTGNDPGPIGADRHADNPAYVLFTSGTTGRPKGVAVTNRGLVNLYSSHRGMLHERAVRSTGRQHLRVGHAWSFAFDASWQPLLWILGGHAIDIVDEDTQRDPDALLARLSAREWDFLELTPTYIEQLLDRGLGTEVPIAMLGFGGEAVSASLWSKLQALSETVAVNLYGPTESTVDSAVAVVTDSERPVIGRPVDGTSAYILDDFLRPVPVGVEGELYLAGAGLARGYIARWGLTAERFVADPIGNGRMYRTGDRARWTFDGLIEYRGRGDDQVKIRGFRIELGEIESVLRAIPGVSDAAAVVRERPGGPPRLIAYVVVDVDVDVDVDVRLEAARVLPDYMVPAAVVVLDKLPLLANGKLDRATLPEPPAPTQGMEPTSDIERTLCDIVAGVVGVESVAADADFFELGGDSIVAMKLVSDARACGLRISPRDVFISRTVIELAKTVENITDMRSADIATGTAPITPVMHWLRGIDAIAPGTTDGYHQSVVLQTPGGVDAGQLDAALTAIARHHDSLRARIRADGEHWNLDIPESDDGRSWLRRRHATGDWPADLRSAALEARSRLDPQAGQMMIAIWIDAGPKSPGRLILAVHHLVVDGVSWRTIVPDLVRTYLRLADGQSPDLGEKGTSFRTWSALLTEQAASRREEIPLWKSMLQEASPLPLSRGINPEVDTVAAVKAISSQLEPEDAVRDLLSVAPHAYGVGVTDLMTAALSVALAQWRHSVSESSIDELATAIIDLERHGREEGLGDVELSRTVGWFTVIHPFRLEGTATEYQALLQGDRSAATALVQRTSTSMASIPDSGIGFGMLRHLLPMSPLMEIPSPLIEFNYLGRFSELAEEDWSFAPDGISAHVGPNPDMPAGHMLEINVSALDTASGPRVRSEWRYLSTVLPVEQVQTLVHTWQNALTALVRLHP
ncbi:non-ribosomal peptide synthetase [Rhodococcus sp. 14-2483-1-2]|uniref:non-ribosomal peptide synthetase n=1 Tax=Rhodococcus sp. 14-2483-1-2 TaxID=2023147 RepID=UPI000B9BFEDB|nr:non-ribosomal peptide synthetase [Rhodococcus sp. 14-2483-1-2]OZF26154.1 hypothetical protein CH295_26400 [Rhodococcus sp. 14-2483-1-2]